MADPNYEEALLNLGNVLEQIGWKPDFPIGQSLDSKGPEERNRLLAMLYIAAHSARLHLALCDGPKIKDSVKIGGEMVAHVTAHLAGLHWLEAVVVAPLASALCAAGVSDFCSSANNA